MAEPERAHQRHSPLFASVALETRPERSRRNRDVPPSPTLRYPHIPCCTKGFYLRQEHGLMIPLVKQHKQGDENIWNLDAKRCPSFFSLSFSAQLVRTLKRLS
jgi:hypothetical protein